MQNKSTAPEGFLPVGLRIACFVLALVLLMAGLLSVVAGMGVADYLAKDPGGYVGGPFWLRFLAVIPVLCGTVLFGVLLARASGHFMGLLTGHEIACKKAERMRAEAEEMRRRMESAGGFGTII